MKKAIIIGGGIGGLCTSIRLLNRGYETIIFEKENTIGGKINRKSVNDVNFDLTASLIMTPNTYISIFKEVGKDYREYFNMELLENTYKVNYYDNTSYEFYYDTTKMINVLEDIDKCLSTEYFKCISNSYRKYLLSKEYLLSKSMVNIRDILNYKSIKTIFKINPFYTSNRYIKKNISNEKIRNFLFFQTMYIGVNPYKVSNIYTLIPAITQLYGLGYIEGGIYNYILALEKLIYELGGKIKVNSSIDEILTQEGKVVGVKCKGENYYSNIVICNADYTYAKNTLLNKSNKVIKKIIKFSGYQFSSSVFMIYLLLDKKYESLKVHNIYINKNFKENIEDAFQGKIPNSPSFYYYYPNMNIKDGNTCLNIMLRVPNLKYTNIKWSKLLIKNTRDSLINAIKNIKELSDIEEHIIYEDYLTPVELKEKFNLDYGNAFGVSHILLQSLYFRPHIKSKNISGLYFINSSTHPGNGASVVIDGTRVLCDLIDSDINK